MLHIFAFQDTLSGGDSFQMHVPHSFIVYTEPDFRSDELGRFGAQNVRLSPFGNDGWASIDTYRGVGFVNTKVMPDIDALNSYLRALSNDVAVFYKNLCTGMTFIHNPERVFFAASLSKANHAFYTFQMAERGYVDMQREHTFTAANHWGGTGILQFKPLGTVLTTRELLGLSIIESDNAAYRMLIRLLENAPVTYHDFVREQGRVQRFIRDIIAQTTSAVDMGMWMYAIWNYIESEDTKYGHYFKHDLLNTSQTSHPYFTRWEGSWGTGGTVNVRLIESDYEMARKYGWSRNAFHDAAIVYAPSPYILVILTNKDRGAHELFEEISLFIQDFNREWFPPAYVAEEAEEEFEETERE